MTPAAERLGILALASATFMSGCSEFRDQAAPSPSTPPVQTSKSYLKVDDNTYILPQPYFRGLRNDARTEDFSKNLAQFRKDVPGDFTLIPSLPAHPFAGEALLIRNTIETKNGQNHVQFQEAKDQVTIPIKNEAALKEPTPQTATPLPHRRTCEELSAK